MYGPQCAKSTIAGINGKISEATVRGCQASSLRIAGKYLRDVLSEGHTFTGLTLVDVRSMVYLFIFLPADPKHTKRPRMGVRFALRG